MAFDPHQFENDEDPGAMIAALIVLGLLAAIILAVLWSDGRRAELDRAFAPIAAPVDAPREERR